MTIPREEVPVAKLALASARIAGVAADLDLLTIEVRQALAALRNAAIGAGGHADPADQARTLRQGIATAVSWLDGTRTTPPPARGGGR